MDLFILSFVCKLAQPKIGGHKKPHQCQIPFSLDTSLNTRLLGHHTHPLKIIALEVRIPQTRASRLRLLWQIEMSSCRIYYINIVFFLYSTAKLYGCNDEFRKLEQQTGLKHTMRKYTPWWIRVCGLYYIYMSLIVQTKRNFFLFRLPIINK